MCVCVLTINGMADVSRLSSFASIWHRKKIIFDTRKTLYLEPPAKLLKTYLKDNGNIYFVVILYFVCNLIKRLFEINSRFPSRKISPESRC